MQQMMNKELSRAFHSWHAFLELRLHLSERSEEVP